MRSSRQAAEKKRERVAKNELQRLRNIKRNMKVPTVGVTPKDVSKSSTSEVREKERGRGEATPLTGLKQLPDVRGFWTRVANVVRAL